MEKTKVKNKFKEQKAITLIALVITVIVLIILAGIGISALTGENGIITKADEAKLETRGGEVQELVDIWKLENTGGKYVEWDVADEDQFIEKLLADEKVFEEELNRENKTITIGKRVIDYGIKSEDDYIGLTTTWRVEEANGSITLPLLGDYNVEIDWGDGGNKESIEGYYNPLDESTSQIQPNHIYKEPGDYNISVTGKYDGFGAFIEEYISYPIGDLDNLIQVLSWGDNSLKRVKFANARNLMYVAEPKTGILKDLINCNYMFYGCESLKTIPEGLFDNCAGVTSFYRTFSNCTLLTSIPEGLFDNCSGVTIFSNTFSDCTSLTSIPEGLFNNCADVTDFSSTFNKCTSLTSIPEGIFDNCADVTSFYSTFRYCTSLTSIPKGLFNNCADVTDFDYTFSNCTLLTSIPEGLFNNCAGVTSFYRTFSNCTLLTSIPKGLFNNCADVTDFAYTFYYCTSLTSIPEGLFNNCTNVTSFHAIFGDCTSLTSIPEGLFDNCAEVTGFGYTFGNCVNVEGKAPNIFTRTNVTSNYRCFYKCNKLSNYKEIPSDWK